MPKPYTVVIYLLIGTVLSPLAVQVDNASGDRRAQVGDIQSKHTVDMRRGNHIMVDGGQYSWDVQYAGTVYKGQDYAYTGAMYLTVHGASFRPVDFTAKKNASGDEIQVGPHYVSGIKCSRRIKVYKDRPLARWLEVLTNTTSNPITAPISIYSRMRYGIQTTKTSSGARTFGKKDWAYFTTTARASAPSTLHVVCSPGARVRPSVQIDHTYLRTNYTLTIPPNKTVLLCHFESQNRDSRKLAAMMKGFSFASLLSDLPVSARTRILNVQGAGLSGYVDLKRSDASDVVILSNGDPMYGTIENRKFTIEALSGSFDLPFDKIVGMRASTGGAFRVLLSGGQVLSGPISSPGGGRAVLDVRLDSAGLLKVPLNRIRQWSSRVSKNKPYDEEMSGPYFVSDVGDRLKLADDPITLEFNTAHGPIKLDSRRLLTVAMKEGDKKRRRLKFKLLAVFASGSHLSGSLAGRKVNLKLRNGRLLTLDGARVAGLHLAGSPKPGVLLSSAELANDDRILGTLCDTEFALATRYGRVQVNRSEFRRAEFKPGRPDETSVELRSSTKLTGRLDKSAIEMEIAPGTRIKLKSGLLKSLDCPMPLPAKAMIRRIELLVAQLGSESLANRKSAIDKLILLGEGVGPVLRRYLKTGDPVVREAIWRVLIRVEGSEEQGTVPNQILPQHRW